MGYILRMSELNHLHGMQWLCNELSVARIHHLSRAAIPLVAWLFGQDPNQFQNSYVEKILSTNATCFRFYGHFISREFLIRHRSPQVCIGCLTENAFIQQHWDISFITECGTHRINLIEHCQSCKRKISWTRPGVSKCQCGFDFRNSKITSNYENDISEWLSNRFYGISSYAINNSYPVLKSFEQLSLDGILRIFWATGIRATESEHVKAGESRRILSIDAAGACIQRSVARLKSIGQPNALKVMRKVFLLSGLFNLLDDFQKCEDADFALRLLSLERNPRSQKASFLNGNPQSQLQLF